MSARGSAISEVWTPVRTDGLPRRARRTVRIDAFVPTPLDDLILTQGTLTSVSDAETAVARAQQHASLVGVGTIAAGLMRSEAIASSQIEGIDAPGHRALSRALLKRDAGTASAALTTPAATTVAHLDVVAASHRRGVRAHERGSAFTVGDLRETHASLARADRWLAAHAGRIRETQNWIGSDPHTPAGADFVPPPARMVPDLVADLCRYISRADVSPVVQAAAAHAQFETIHPFSDGNGRVGRTLIGEILCRGGLARDVVPPVSLVLAGRRDVYVEMLTAWRYQRDGPDLWVRFLAETIERAAVATLRLAEDVAALVARWHEMVAHRRADSAARRLVDVLPAYPMVTAHAAADVLGATYETGRAGVTALVEDGVLVPVTVARRHRAFEPIGLFALIDDLERDLGGGRVRIAETGG